MTRPAVPYATDPRVEAFIAALPDWQQATRREVRDAVHAADAEVTETIKRARQPYFVLQGNVCALLAANEHVNVFLYNGGIVADLRGSSPAATRTRPPAPSPSTEEIESTCPP